MSAAGDAARERMLARMDLYAAARKAGARPGDAATAIGLRSDSTRGAYERWYRRERLGLPARARRYSR
jgi:hypothetical protein